MLKRAANIQGFKLLCNNTLFFFLSAVLSLNSMKNPPQYSEKSGFPSWIFWSIAAVAIIQATILPTIYLYEKIAHPTDSEPLDWFGLAIFGVVGLLIFVIKLHVTINTEGITYKYPPFRNKPTTLPWENIKSIELMRINPLKEFGGWGLRYGKLGTAYTTRGRYILHVVQNTGNPINLTIAAPKDFVKAIAQQNWPVTPKIPEKII
jgi:hypothetical protein